MRRLFYCGVIGLFVAFGILVLHHTATANESSTVVQPTSTDPASPQAFSLIVMDPLAAPLSCPCVEGYAQRKYDVLADRLQAATGRPVALTFAESLSMALKKTAGNADLIIGKDSVVRADAKVANQRITPLGMLSDKTGSTTQFGMILVHQADPAESIDDLAGYSIIFGPPEADEKHAAILTLLSEAGISVPEKLSISAACSDGACKVIDRGPDSKTAAVISSYAAPLLEGCGTIKKGDLRVVAKSKPVPFITAFVTDRVSATERRQVESVLFGLISDAEATVALETLAGFLPVEATPADSPTVSVGDSASGHSDAVKKK